MPHSADHAETTITVRSGAWHDEADLPLRFPAGWQVRRMAPADAPAVSPDQIDRAFDQPVGSEALHRLAAGKRSAAIAVDDLTRPTPVETILPRVINELIRGGMVAERIRILIGAAAHRPMTPQEMNVKLGDDICRRFKPIMHDFMGPDLCPVGWVRGGPVSLNRHFLAADLRICIGGVIPHAETGFGGGAKMVVPGLAGRRTIAHLHGALPARPAGQLEAGGKGLDRRSWAEHVARHIGVHAVACAVVNSRRELAGLHVGDVVSAHRAAARDAARLGRTVLPADLAAKANVVVVNAYPLDTDPIQMGKSVAIARKLPAELTVVINAASDGIFYHGMGMGSGIDVRRLMRNVPGWLVSPVSQWTMVRGMLQAIRRPVLAARLCYFSLNHLSYAAFERGRQDRREPDEGRKNVDEAAAHPFVVSKRFPMWGFRRKYPRGRLCRDWYEVEKRLARRSGTGVALVFPCGPLQLLEIAGSDHG